MFRRDRLDGPNSGMLPPMIRNPISPTALHASDREAYATTTAAAAAATTPFVARNHLSLNPQSAYGQYPPDTPRSVISGLAYAPSPASTAYPSHHMAAAGGYPSSSQSECGNFPWPNLEILSDMTCAGQAVTPEVHAKVEKGFFLAPLDQKWTCYRRNYFSVMCSFELHPNINNGRVELKRNNTSEPIQALGMRLSAAVDGSGGKNIELIQYTPKRDAGAKTKIDVTKVFPTPSNGRGEHTLSPNGVYQIPLSTFHPTGSVSGPYLPFQNTGEINGSTTASTVQSPSLAAQYPYAAAANAQQPLPGQNITHTFERVQFKQATANNGKRRASQQYFHLIVELFADVRKDGADAPTWVKVAQRVSDKIVVRGRSPSHYHNDGQPAQPSRGPGSSSGGGSSSGYSMASGAVGGYGGMNPGGFRSSAGGYGGSSGGGGGNYRTNHYGGAGGLQASPDGSGSDSGSMDEGGHAAAVDAAMTDATDRPDVHHDSADNYQYYPSTIYEHVPPPPHHHHQHPQHHPQQTLPPLAKVEALTTAGEPRYAVKAEFADAVPGPRWQAVGGVERFQGVASSRGYFPDLSAGFS